MRIAVLGDFEGLHTRRWLEVFVSRGHDVRAISYYRPRAALPGVHVHVLSGHDAPALDGLASGQTPYRSLRSFIPPSLARFVHAWRYRRAGLSRVLAEIAPDVFHAHYVVEHGFYGALAGFHPYVVSAWGSDLLLESHKALGRLVARYTLGHADLVTANDPALGRRAVALGAAPDRVRVIRLGIDPLFCEAPGHSVNLEPSEKESPTVISDRALEPLYNAGLVLRAFARLRRRLPAARLLIANDGSERARLEALAGELGLGDSVRFLGRLEPPALLRALESAQVYVSVPDSDSFALSTLEAMAAGCFPVISDLPSADGMITDSVNGLRVPPGDLTRLADALTQALGDAELRRRAVAPNRALVEAEGRREQNMLALERLYYRLAGRPVAGSEAI